MRGLLVTGGAGFIGAHLVRALVDRGEAVRVVDDLTAGTALNLSRATGVAVSKVRARLAEARRGLVSLGDRCELRVGSILDPGVMAEACSGVDVILHEAALRAVPRSLRDPLGTHDVNATGTLRVLEAARAAGVRKVVFASSSSVYGDTPVPKHEGQVPQPKSPYAASKVAAEAYCQAYARAFGLSTVALRYFNVFGPGQDPASEYAAVIPKFITLAMRGEPVPVYGDGLQSRDFTYVDNVVDANLAAAAAEVNFAVLNVGAGSRHTLLELIGGIERILGRSIKRIHEPPRPGDVRESQADIALAQWLIGYQPRVSFEQGLRQTIDALRATEEPLVQQG